MEFEDREGYEKEIGLPASNYYSGQPNTSDPVEVDAAPRKPRYKECMKNHAAGLGGQAVDGCCEFMPAGAEGSFDALKCAACNCHRNFHRKETGGNALNLSHHHLTRHPFSPYYRPTSGYLHAAPHQRPLALPSRLGGGGGGWQSREDQEDLSNPANTKSMGGVSKKRHRTKFSKEEKEKMLGVSERLGWRIQKEEEAVVQQFCNETGVKRHVLKVWMHNNKHTLGKKL